jgi:hypothetical protein
MQVFLSANSGCCHCDVITGDRWTAVLSVLMVLGWLPTVFMVVFFFFRLPAVFLHVRRRLRKHKFIGNPSGRERKAEAASYSRCLLRWRILCTIIHAFGGISDAQFIYRTFAAVILESAECRFHIHFGFS